MPYIKADEIQQLIEVENYLGEKENWSENTYKIWSIVEKLLSRQKKDNEKSKKVMAYKRATDPKYDRRKKK